MNVVIMGCGRVGAELTVQLAKSGHRVAIVDKRKDAFDRLPPGFQAQTVVGVGYDRDVLEEAGIKEADAFIAVSNGDNSNIVSARVAREHYHVERVVARIYDPKRAEIYERLDIPTIATVRWAAKQILMMLFHPREELKESLAGGAVFRMRVDVPKHLVGKAVTELSADGKVLVAAVDRGGRGFIPDGRSTFQEGDVAQLIVDHEAIGTVDELLKPLADG
jgi:trk/ktr system potassium uptake protein